MTDRAAESALPRRVVVTGATGKLGRAVVAHLRAVGVDVLAVDRAAGRDPRDVDGEFLLADLGDYGQVVEALTGGADEHGGPVDAARYSRPDLVSATGVRRTWPADRRSRPGPRSAGSPGYPPPGSAPAR
ncbi:NAD-dependent epimerase/dehydratase family protein [Micromonospora sp. NBC_00421]